MTTTPNAATDPTTASALRQSRWIAAALADNVASQLMQVYVCGDTAETFVKWLILLVAETSR